MKKHIFFWAIIFIAQGLFSQVVTVTDEDSGQPLDLVTLMSSNPKAFATTNADGQADISNFEGSEKIEIRTLGYNTVYRSYAELRNSNFEIVLSISSISIDQVVISATRWNQSTSDIPSKIISISPETVALQNPQTAADLLAASGKVFIQKSQQGGGSPMIRGFSTNRLLYTVDGVRMNTAIFRGGNLQNVISLDPFAMERTEVLFGPDAVIYGSDAIGGVMSFQTLVPEFSVNEKPYITGNAVTRYASANNEKTGHFDVNVGWKKWAFVSSISSNDYGDLKQGSTGPDEFLRPFYVKREDSMDVVVTNEDPKVQNPSGYTQINMMQKVRFKPNEKWDFQYGFHYSETSEYSRYDRHQRLRDGLPRYGEWKYGPQKWMMNNLSVFNTESTPLYDEMALRLAIQNFEESRISRNFNDDNRETRVEKVDAYSVNLDFTKIVGESNTLFYGFEMVYDDVTSTGTDTNIATGVSAKGPARYPNATWASYAAYISDQFKVNDQLVLQEDEVIYPQFLTENGSTVHRDASQRYYARCFQQCW